MRFFTFCLLFLCPFFVSAEVYKWVDEGGRTHFSDNKPVGKTVNPLDLKPITNTYSTPKISFLPDLPEINSSRAERVVMYSAAWCGVCKKAREYFQKNTIAFTEYDADSDNKCNFLGRRPADIVRLFSRQRKLHNELQSADRK